MSFKYRFILFFVLLEVFFIILIVSVNFIAINNSSNKLIQDKIESNISFLDELLKVPISIYDLATLDNFVLKSDKLKHINSIIILDSQERILSQKYNFKHIKLEHILEQKKDFKFELENEVFEIRYRKIYEENTYLGSMHLIFDISDNKQFIQKNKQNTIFIIILEILISTIFSYLLGSRLTKMLTELSQTAVEIGQNKHPNIPYRNKKNEIGILANSMNQMQVDLKQRNEKLQELARVLNNQKNELISANKDKDDFLANMSHELKTPLNSINIISSIMIKNKKNNLDEKDIENLKILNTCGKDLLFLINDILDISKLEANEITPIYEKVNLPNLINELNMMFKPLANEKEINFICYYDNKPIVMISDFDRIKQILKNLLSNAFKFTKKGQVTLDVIDSDNFVEFIVTDNGIGIEENKLIHIFDRFKQVDSSTTRKFGGTGLGLSISKELSQLLGGDITVKSKLSEGSIFKLTISKNLDKLEFIKKNNEIEIKTTNKKDILVFNSNPIVFMNLIINLNKNYTVTQVNNFDDFLTKINQKKFDLLLFDIKDIKNFTFLENSKVQNKFICFCEDKELLNDYVKRYSLAFFTEPITFKMIEKYL